MSLDIESHGENVEHRYQKCDFLQFSRCEREKRISTFELTGKIQTEQTFVSWKNEIVVDQFGVLVQQGNAIADQRLKVEQKEHLRSNGENQSCFFGQNLREEKSSDVEKSKIVSFEDKPFLPARRRKNRSRRMRKRTSSKNARRSNSTHIGFTERSRSVAGHRARRFVVAERFAEFLSAGFAARFTRFRFGDRRALLDWFLLFFRRFRRVFAIGLEEFVEFRFVEFRLTFAAVAVAPGLPLDGAVVAVTPDFFLPAAVGLEFIDVRRSAPIRRADGSVPELSTMLDCSNNFRR